MLTLYSASAGSGKTHTLTGEYLSLLFSGKDKHRHILAVTFTNKATAEMKSRIIEELFRLADNQPSDYIPLLAKGGEDEIRHTARKILITILHDYSAFNISTIDHFFQRTIRAFTREIGLQGNYQIELDEEQMLEEAVESMLFDLEKSENKALTNWLLRFTEDKIEESGGWDIRRDIVNLGRQLFKETYKAYSDNIQNELQEKQALAGYLDDLRQIVQSTRAQAKDWGEKGLELIRRNGLQTSDFKGGSVRSPFRYFEKLAAGSMDEPTATFRKLPDNVDEYMAKTASTELRHAAERLYNNGMNGVVGGVIAFFDNLPHYHTANEIVRNFYALGILADLSKHIAQWREENNKLLITDTTELLNKVIDGSEIPFIYEKTGTRIEHYMIDEFQDTSGMQWDNFRPLLKDSLDSGRRNLIVGDVKQSIYRFRNSDWTLLDHQVKVDFRNCINEKNLHVNWRSFRHIVEFNNMLFQSLPCILQNAYNEEVEQSSLSESEKAQHRLRITTAYQHAQQEVAPPLAGKDGHVQIQFLADTDEATWKEQSMEQLPHIVEQLQENGYELRDMAILTRTGQEGVLAAETLLKYRETHPESPYKYDIISEDSLTVNSSLSVRWMIAMLKYLYQPDVESHYDRARMTYSVMKRKATAEATPAKDFHLQDLPPELLAALKRFSNRSLYELAENLFSLFEHDFPANEFVFIQAFLDMAADYSSRETADTGAFLTWWDETGYRKKIVTPDSRNAIRITTVHKSKGLGFKVVIMPFADWKIDRNDAILWCRPVRKPFDRMSLVPVKYSRNLKNTFFAADYFHEKLHTCMDSLNTLYVAFTRAKEELVIIAPRPKNDADANSIAGLLWNGLSTDGQYQLNAESGLYERGRTARQTAGQPARQTGEQLVERFYSVSPDRRMQLRLSRKGGLDSDDRRKYGLFIHDILSGVVTCNDVDAVLSQKQAAGEITREEAGVLRDRLTALATQETVKRWFDGSMRVLNEVEILYGNGQAARPDRLMIDGDDRVVVVDYKSGVPQPHHRSQIETYKSLVGGMGYRHVDGYLWYIALGEVVPV